MRPPSSERWITCPNQPPDGAAQMRSGSTEDPATWYTSQPGKCGPSTVQSRRAPGGKEFDETARVVRRIAVALGADDDIKVSLGFQFAQRIRIGAQQAQRQAGRLDRLRQTFGLAPGVSGLAAIHDGDLRRGIGRRARQGFLRGRLMAGGKPGGVAGKPVQRGGIESSYQVREQQGLVVGKRYQRVDRLCGHVLRTSRRPNDNSAADGRAEGSDRNVRMRFGYRR